MATRPRTASRGSATAHAAPHAMFLHGAGAWGGQWAIWRRAFEAEGWRTAAPDRQPSSGGLAATRFDDHVAQCVDALASMSVAAGPTEDRVAPVLIGASLGGLLALAVAASRAGSGAGPSASRPTAPRALILVNPLPPAPWARELPPRVIDGDVVPWHSQGRFASTVRAMPGAAFTDRRHAFHHWRDESAALLREAQAGVPLPAPDVPVLVIASDADADVPPSLSAAFAKAIGASFATVAGGHVEPVMGASAAHAATLAMAWLEASAPAR